MNLLRKLFLIILFVAGLLRQSGAQSRQLVPNEPNLNKPALFADQPGSILVHVSTLNYLLEQPVNGATIFDLAPRFSISGTVVSVGQSQNPQFNSVVIKSSNRLGSVLTISRVMEESGKMVYNGRLLSRNHKDAFELVASQGNYYLVKRGYYDLNEE